MAKKIYRILSWSVLIVTLVCLFLVLRKPSIAPVDASPEAAKSFDQKLTQLAEAHRQGSPQEVRITESELNSKLQESVHDRAATGAKVQDAIVHLVGSRFEGTFAANLSGKDLYVTLGGQLAAANGAVSITPTDVRLGSLPIPLVLVEPALRRRLESPEAREHLQLPDWITNVRIENGELVLESK